MPHFMSYSPRSTVPRLVAASPKLALEAAFLALFAACRSKPTVLQALRRRLTAYSMRSANELECEETFDRHRPSQDQHQP
jgi:hypothetical protein